MKITRNVILDLLPLYVADEVSSDTKILIQEYLEKDPELANIIKRSEVKKEVGDIPVPLNVEDKMRTFQKTKLYLSIFIMVIAAVIGVGVMLLFFLTSQ